MADENRGPERPHDMPPADDAGGTHYDSFLIRVWGRDDRSRFIRAELRHIQSETSVTATDVDADWVAAVLTRHLSGRGEPAPE